MLMPPLLVVAIAVVFIASACGGGPSSVQPFVSLATSGFQVTFDPLTSPRDAVDKADLIIGGAVVEVAEGISLRFSDPASTRRYANSHMTLVIAVDTVISGDQAQVRRGRVYVAVRKSSAASTEQLSALNPRPKIIAVLDDISMWTPSAGVEVIRPAAVPSDAPLYAPYTDGMWLQASGDGIMRGLGADHEELAPAWGGPRTVKEFAAALDRATQ
jgi:hypothetical protein